MDKSENEYYLTANKSIPEQSKKIKQPHWTNDEIKNLWYQRRQSKTDQEKYNRIHKEIQKQCKCTKEQWLEEKCREIERLKDINNMEMFKKILEIQPEKDPYQHPEAFDHQTAISCVNLKIKQDVRRNAEFLYFMTTEKKMMVR